MPRKAALPPAGKGDTFCTSDGFQLYFETWQPECVARAEIIFFHGVHESADTKTARRLAAGAVAAGMRFRALEDHAHGRSVGKHDTHGLVRDFEMLVEHSREFVSHVRGTASAADAERNSGSADMRSTVPLVLMGHSMGGATAALLSDSLRSPSLNETETEDGHACASRAESDGFEDFVGCVLLAPSLLCTAPPRLLVAALTVVSWLLPSAPLGPPEHGAIYDTGSGLGLNYSGKMRLQTGKLFLDLNDAVEAAMARSRAGGDSDSSGTSNGTRMPGGGTLRLNFPMLIMHGTDDHAVPFAGSEQLLEHAQSSDKTLHALHGRGHQALCERGWQDVSAQIFAWISQRVEAKL